MATLIKRRRSDGKLSYRVQDRTTGYPSLSETFPTLKAAREFKRRVEADRQAGLTGIRRGRQLLDDAIYDFTQTADFRKRKAARDTLRHLRWWSHRLGRLPLGKITPDLVADHLHSLEAAGRSGSTVNRYRSALSRVFRYAVKSRRWVDQNPCAMIERRDEGRPRERVISPSEWRRLLKASTKLAVSSQPKSPRSQLVNFLKVVYGTAARKSDVRRLRWEYVDLEEHRVTFHDPKTGNGYSIPLLEEALTALSDQARLRSENCPWVFPSPKGGSNPAWFDGAFRQARVQAGLDMADARGESLTIHSLRHSAATEAGRAGASAFEVQAMTGHRTLAMVQRYTKIDETNALAALTKRSKL